MLYTKGQHFLHSQGQLKEKSHKIIREMKMDKNGSSRRHDAVSTASIILSAISFLADVLALAQVAYNLIAKNETTNLALQLIAIVLVFMLGFVLGSIGFRGLEKTTIDKVLQVYIWAYLILACLSYLGVVGVFRQPYTLSSYVAYFVIISLQLGAFTILRNASEVKPVLAHALALMTVSVLHALIFLYQFIFVNIPPIIYVIGEWAFWFAWNLYAVPMIRNAFIAGKERSGLR